MMQLTNFFSFSPDRIVEPISINSGRSVLSRNVTQGVLKNNASSDTVPESVIIQNAYFSSLENSKNPSITCISSICGNASIGCPIPYSTAKASLNHYVKNLSKLIAYKNIRINSISPGNILFKGSTWEKKINENLNGVSDFIKKNVPLNKIGETSDISEMVLYLSSDSSKFITGSNIVIDGGQIA